MRKGSGSVTGGVPFLACPDVSPAIKARDFKGPSSDGDGDGAPLIAHTLRAEGHDASEDGTGRGVPIVPIPFDTTQITSRLNRSNPKPGDPCHPLASGAHVPAVAFNWQSGGDGRGLDPKPVTSALTKEQTPATFSGQGVRRLMPHELERLQGFPDDYTRIPYRGKPAEDCPDGPRAKALGNSMAVPVMRWIGERIHQVDGVPSHVRAVGSQSTQAHR